MLKDFRPGESAFGAVPVGGTTGQVLAKSTSADYDTAWVTPASGGVTPAEFLAAQELVKEPTGYPNRTDSVMTFTNATRTFSIAPTGSSFDVHIKGHKFTKTTAQTKVISNTPGNHYIYFDVNGVLQETTSFTSAILQDNAFTAIAYWNTDTSTCTYFAEERHGLLMDGETHSYLHTVFGARYLSGLALQNFSVDGSGSLAAHAQFTSDLGSIRDEDILHSIAAQTQIAVFFRQGSLWRKKTADAFPMIYSGTAGYTGTNGLIPFNQYVAGSWQLTEADSSKFVLIHLFATNDVSSPVIAIQGTAQHGSIASARLNANTEITQLSGLPFAEFVAIGSVIVQASTSYTNTTKARIRSTDIGSTYVDFRGTQLYTPAGEATTHGLLSGLGNDDHPQYHNDVRGDERYYTKPDAYTLSIVNALIFG